MRSGHYFVSLSIAAVLIHAGSLAWAFHREGCIDAYAFNSLDCGEYFSIARNIIHKGTFSQNEAAPFSPDTWRTPGYPMFLAAGMLLVGDSPTGLILIQHLAAIGSVLIFFKIASRYLSSGRATIAAAIFLVEPYHLFYSFWLLSTTFFTLILLAAWWAWERTRESSSARHLVVLGFLSGFLVLIWPGAALIPFFVIAGLAIHFRSKKNAAQHEVTPSSRSNRFGLVLVSIACIAPPLVWMTRNKVVAGHFALSHQSGIVLAYFKATEVELWRQGRTEDRYVETSLDPARRNDPHAVWEGIDAELVGIMNALCVAYVGGSSGEDPCRLDELTWSNLAQGNKTSHDSFEVSRVLSWIGIRMLLESPFSTITCGGVRVIENLTFPLDLALKPAEGASVNRVKATALGLAYSILVLAALFGVYRVWGQWPAFYFPISCIIALALATAPQIDPRFRVPLIPCLVFFALFPTLRTEL